METLQLEELWRRGGETDDLFFGVLLKALTDAAGNIYVLDYQLCEVQVFTPDGELLKTTSRKGEGPGEVVDPMDMLWMPDGNLGIVQSFPGRIVQIDTQDNPAGILKVGGAGAFMALTEARSGGGNLVMGVLDIQFDEAGQNRQFYLGSFDTEANELARYGGFDFHWRYPDVVLRERENLYWTFGSWDVGADGRVVTAPHFDEYVFHVYSADGTLERIVSRDFDPCPRDAHDKALITGILDGARGQFEFEVEIEVEEYEQPVAQLLARSNGENWIVSARGSRNQPGNILMTWDVFDAEGIFAKQVRIACAGDGRRDGMFFLGDRILVMHGLLDAMGTLVGSSAVAEGKPEPIEMICYRVAD